ncbi:3-deoxy-D-manno-octulosonic acid transferase, partial [Salmonella sp. SAL4436]|uniref:3-deoxy-D-manno-octulosonic acid transferase n=1 Tax=Salmonella sp. SAL4436 TaxID=3159891 RepID=UPI00397A01D4
AAGRAVWVAGSTHEGEEDIVLDAHARVRQNVHDALLVLVPRHPNRFDAVATHLRRRAIRFVTLSSESRVRPDTEVLLVDSVGQLMT